MERFAVAIPVWLSSLILVIAVVGGAVLLHWIAFAIAGRWARRTKSTVDDLALARLRAPSFWLLIAFALSAVLSGFALSPEFEIAWHQVAGLVFPALLGWLAAAVLGLVTDIVKVRADITVEDNLQARRRRTRADILYRIAISTVVLTAFCLMLMSIPAVRSVGVTLIASAGLAALAVGAAAQPALKNLIAGFQMVFTEPIRLDDVVIMDGEWGRIEEIRLTYVVVKIWDERRLVVPVSKFLENSFQNWTRTTAQIMGSVFWYLDPATDVPRLRAELAEIIKANKRWDGRFFNLQVTDTKPEAIEVRALMTAKDASTAFDLRCDVREAMLDFIRAEMPEAITRYRGDFAFTQPEAAPASAPS